MNVSYTWLQKYFKESLPEINELADLLTFHSFEIEGVEEDRIDIDILPNRSSDCLSHRGIAREIGTLLEREIDDPYKKELVDFPKSKLLSIEIENKELCPRYAAGVIKGVKVGPSPDWLVGALQSIGQKSINNIVDATNYVMFNLGQPLHVFDLDKLNGKILVRNAQEGEKITVLGGDEYTLSASNVVITDGKNPIGIAGVKGGMKAETDQNTTNIVIEGAHFDYTSVRKTAQKLKLWTDASIRFQNQPSPKLVGYALRDVIALILDITGGELEGVVDEYLIKKENKPVSVSISEINGLLGTDISIKEVEDIFTRLGFEYSSNFTVTPPFERTDITIKEDLIEEVGRIYGYKNINALQLPAVKIPPIVHKGYYYAEKVRGVLLHEGFSEVHTYVFRDKGDIEVISPFASDKNFLRRNLFDGISGSLEMNRKNAPLFGLDVIGIFEIGNIFSQDKESLSLAITYSGKEKRLNEVKEILERELGVPITENVTENVLEINFTELIKKLPDLDSYEPFEKKEIIRYKSISQYPFMLRDIALWVPERVSASDVLNLIENKLLVVKTPFDVYKKEGRISYAFHLVFQSLERTLSDVEVNKIMENITAKLSGNEGWEIR